MLASLRGSGTVVYVSRWRYHTLSHDAPQRSSLPSARSAELSSEFLAQCNHNSPLLIGKPGQTLDGRRGSYLVVPQTKTVHVGMVVVGRCTCSSTSRKTSHSKESRWDNCAAVLTWGLHIHGGTQSSPCDALVWSSRLILGRTRRRSPFETLHLKRDQDPQLLCSRVQRSELFLSTSPAFGQSAEDVLRGPQ